MPRASLKAAGADSAIADEENETLNLFAEGLEIDEGRANEGGAEEGEQGRRDRVGFHRGPFLLGGRIDRFRVVRSTRFQFRCGRPGPTGGRFIRRMRHAFMRA